MKILVIGTGYVGTTTSLVLCEKGHQVTALDIDETKVKTLQAGKLHFYEPGLDELLLTHIQNRNIIFTNEPKEAIMENDVIFICVGTPQGLDGNADLTYIRQAAESIGKHMNKYKVVINKSTVPVGTADLVREWIKSNQLTYIEFDVLSNPEFLREGTALEDALNPDRIVIGSLSVKATNIVKNLYSGYECPIVETTPRAAELIKYGSNSFLALKISFINELGWLCKELDVSVDDIAQGIGLDQRIGTSFFKAGIGFGGSCFPKDVSALLFTAKKHNQRLKIIESAVEVNELQIQYFMNMVKSHLGEVSGKKFAVLGLAFKANTDDTRESPALKIISTLLKADAKVVCYDPKATITGQSVMQSHNIVDTLTDCDAVIICTEWVEFKNFEWGKYKHLMKSPIIFDGRNILDKIAMEELGYIYYCI